MPGLRNASKLSRSARAVRGDGIFGDRIKPPGRHVTHNALIELGRLELLEPRTEGGKLLRRKLGHGSLDFIHSRHASQHSTARLTRQIRRLS
jgi:hypothetical protein